YFFIISCHHGIQWNHDLSFLASGTQKGERQQQANRYFFHCTLVLGSQKRKISCKISHTATFFKVILTSLLVGVLLFSATESMGTRTFVSGKYVTVQVFGTL